MFFRILQKDLKRKKVMNFILLIFMILASMFVASGVNNVLTVLSGTDYYFEQAGIGDYTVLTVGTKDSRELTQILDEADAVSGYRMEECLFASQDNVKTIDKEKVETKNTAVFQAIEDAALCFFDMDNQKITEIPQGHVYTTGDFLEKNHLQIGDKILLSFGNTKLTLTLDGKAKDALLGSDFMGNTRFLMNTADMEQFWKDTSIENGYYGQITYIEASDTRALASVVNQIPNVNFQGPRSTIKMCYVMDLIVAFIVLILSVCLMIVALVVLRFIISLTVTEEFREIGVMKAIGIPSGGIRGIYLVKYFSLAVIGASIGFLASIPFGNLLMKSVSENMVLGNHIGIVANAAGALFIVAVVVLFAFGCTRRVKKVTPVDAIRCGQTGERYHKTSVCRIGTCVGDNSLFLAVNDVFSHPRRFVTIILSFFICTSLVLIIVNTVATMTSDRLIDSFGTKSDLYVTDVDSVMQYMYADGRAGLEQHMQEKEAELAEEGMPAEYSIELQFKYVIEFEGQAYKITCLQGMNTQISDYKFTEGLAPEGADEIAITPQVSELTGAKLGDVITIDYGTQKKECVVTAYFETMNQLGEAIRLHESADTDFAYISSMMSYQIDFTDAPDEEQVEERKARIKKLYDNDKVMNASEYCADCIGVVDMMQSVKLLLLGITLVVVMLVVILMEQSFITNEKDAIALLKAIGFSHSFVIRWQICRFGLVAFFAVFLAAVLSIPLTKLCISPIFGMMGQRSIDYKIEPLLTFVGYPLLILAVTGVTVWLTALGSKRIKSNEMMNHQV